MRALIAYALAGGGLVGAGTLALVHLLAPEAGRAVRWAAVLAYAVQVAAFALLVAVRHRRLALLAVWGGGTLLRMGVILGAALWLTREAGLAPAPLLVGLAGFFFLLLLLEPVFFRAGPRDAVSAAGRGGRA